MLLYRVVGKRANAVLNGRGAARSKANRWNSKGTEIIYASESRELALAEMSSYLPVGLLPDPYLMVIEVAGTDDQILELDELDYPDQWDKVPPSHKTQLIGDLFVSKRQGVGLRVKSRHSSTERGNVLLNPDHPDFAQVIKIKALQPLKSKDGL